MKKRQFQFLNDSNMAVVEEVAGNQRLFPHTNQLPQLLKLINREFRLPLPNKLARADHRAPDVVKHLLLSAATGFCSVFNEVRSDQVQLKSLPDQHHVARVTIVQQVTLMRANGNVHYFTFYGGNDFSPEIRLNGDRILITTHVLDRFRQRVPSNPGAGLANLISVLFGHPWMTALVNGNPVFVVPCEETFFAFPFTRDPEGILLLTCLTIYQITTFTPSPLKIFNLHYSEKFSPPQNRNWDPVLTMKRFHGMWLNKTPFPPVVPPLNENETWTQLAYKLTDPVEWAGENANRRLVFIDEIPGPFERFV